MDRYVMGGLVNQQENYCFLIALINDQTLSMQLCLKRMEISRGLCRRVLVSDSKFSPLPDYSLIRRLHSISPLLSF